MNDIVIKVENLSKQYRLGEVGTGSLKDDIIRFKYSLMGKENPFLKIGDVNERNIKNKSPYVWALQDINFEIARGEVVGIIGRNGAGKSTLLKILSRTTGPTTGNVKIKGRIASLLEVGTGFHGELSGRENIYLNGAIMGLRKHEITNKLEEIIDFAGVEKYIDTPVKRYSSGMYVRLAFGVAAHLEPDIMIVDEVLAVGDAEFQKKALGKMKDVSTKGGRTVLFVSHNMQAIKQLCNSCIILKNGKIVESGDVTNTINNYLATESQVITKRSWSLIEAPGNTIVKLVAVYAHCEDFTIPKNGNFEITEKIGITISYHVLQEGHRFIHGANIYNNEDINIFNSHDVTSDFRDEKKEKGIYEATMWIPGNLMSEGLFTLSVALFVPAPFEIFVHAERAISFSVSDEMKGDSARGHYTQGFPGYIRPLLQWYSKKI